LRAGSVGRALQLHPAKLRPIDDLASAYYLDLEVVDRPGVLATVAGVMGDHQVSIQSMDQEGSASPSGREAGGRARIVFITHSARERDIQACLTALRSLDVVSRVGTLL